MLLGTSLLLSVTITLLVFGVVWPSDSPAMCPRSVNDVTLVLDQILAESLRSCLWFCPSWWPLFDYAVSGLQIPRLAAQISDLPFAPRSLSAMTARTLCVVIGLGWCLGTLWAIVGLLLPWENFSRWARLEFPQNFDIFRNFEQAIPLTSEQETAPLDAEDVLSLFAKFPHPLHW